MESTILWLLDRILFFIMAFIWIGIMDRTLDFIRQSFVLVSWFSTSFRPLIVSLFLVKYIGSDLEHLELEDHNRNRRPKTTPG